MSVPLTLEDFGVETTPAPARTIDIAELEFETQAAREQGYAAGWSDGERSARDEITAAEQTMRRQIEVFDVTCEQARAHVMRSLTPLLRTIVENAVPHLLRETLGARLTGLFEELAEDAADTPMILAIAPDDADTLRDLIEDKTRFPVEVRPDASLPDGIVHLRLGEVEREMDFDALERRLTEALSALDTHNEEILSNGR